MPRPRKYADTIVKSFSIEREVYESLRAVLAGQGMSVSEEVNELLKKRLAELKGNERSNAEALDYEALKREHVKLMEETIRLTRLLEKLKVYDVLVEVAEKLGLNFETFDNAEELQSKCFKLGKDQRWPYTYS